MNHDEVTQIFHHTGTIQEHIYHTGQILMSGNKRDFIHTNVESVQSISTLLLRLHHVCERCKLLFISFAFSANKALSASNSRLNTSISPQKCKPKILHSNSDTKLFIYRGNRSGEENASLIYYTNLCFLQNPHLNG